MLMVPLRISQVPRLMMEVRQLLLKVAVLSYDQAIWLHLPLQPTYRLLEPVKMSTMIHHPNSHLSRVTEKV